MSDNTENLTIIHPIFYDTWGNQYYDPRFLDKEIIDVKIREISLNKVDLNPESGEWCFNEKKKLLKLGGSISDGRIKVYIK